MTKRYYYIFWLLCLAVMSRAAGIGDDYDFVVAADGSGDYSTIQAAINAVPDYRKAGPTRILVRKGIYKEKVVIAQSKEKVQLIGEDGAVITYDDYASKPNIFGENKGTSGSGSIYIFSPDDLDNDNVISIVETVPTFLRSKDMLDSIQSRMSDDNSLETSNNPSEEDNVIHF